MLYNTRQTYGLVAQLLHWATALLIFVLIPLGIFMHGLPVSNADEVVYKSWYYSLHKTLGVTVLGVAIIRILWTLIQPKPGALNTDRKFESFLASTVHWTLYGAIVLMPVTGWLHHSALEGFAPIWWPFGQDLPFVPKNAELAGMFGAAHFLTGVLLGMSLVFHIAGALKHAIFDRDMTLKRMVPGIQVDGDNLSIGRSGTIMPVGAAVLCFLMIGFASVGEQINHSHEHDHVHDTDSRSVVETSSEHNNISSDDGIMKWVVDHAKSKLTISITQSGKPVLGEFESWQADIAFDPEQLERSRIKASVNIGSLKLGGVTDKALDQPFLDVKQFPSAEFVADEIDRVADGRYEAKGQLTIIGVSKPFVLPFTLEIKEGRSFAAAAATIKRLDFNVGEKGFQTDGTVGFDVSVKVKLEAQGLR